MSQVHSSSYLSVSLPPITYKSQPVCTTEMLAQAYGCTVKNIQDNFSNNRERFSEGKHFVAVTNGELRDFRLHSESFGLQISPKARQLTLWLERGAARHAKMLNTDKAWDVFELLEETFFRVIPSPSTPSPDAPLTPDQQCTLQALVKAKVEAIPEANRPKGVYPQVWSRFNNHFRLGSYKQLPQARLSEAVDYLTRLEIKPARPTGLALPAGKSLEVTGVDAMERLLRLRADLFRVSVDVRMVLSNPFWKGPGNSETPEHQRKFSAALNEALGGFFLAVNNNLIAAEQMFKAYVEAEKMLNG